MAALLVAMSIMAVMLSVAMPVWKQASTREKEEELVFRGLQYVHAIGLFQRKFANAYPPNVDVLVEQRFLRKKFKDPITNDDFAIIPVGQGLPGTAPAGRGQGGASGTGTSGGSANSPSSAAGSSSRGLSSTPSTQATGRGASSGSTMGGGAGIQTTAGIAGVTSKSKDTSIRLYNGRSHYNEWAFVYTPQLQAGQGGAPGLAAPGQRGNPPGGPGQRGNQPGDPFGRGRGPDGRGPNPFGPGNPPGGRGFGPGTGPTPIQPIFGPQPTPRGRE